MNETIQASPLQWPEYLGIARTPPAERKSANFGKRNDAGWGNRRLTVAQARRRLMVEISRFTRAGRAWRIDPDAVVVSTNMPTRQDGLPYSNAREPDDPGVAVYYELDGEPFCLPCDKWDRLADNIAAIAKHIEAIRGQERWGVASAKASFHRFALPTPETAGGEPWHVTLHCQPDVSFEEAQLAYRRRAKQTHPDNPGGSHEEFHAVQTAWTMAKQQLEK